MPIFGIEHETAPETVDARPWRLAGIPIEFFSDSLLEGLREPLEKPINSPSLARLLQRITFFRIVGVDFGWSRPGIEK